MRKLFALALVLTITSPTQAQDHAADSSAPTRTERRLVELVSKVSFNEGLDSEHDRAMIWQIVEGHGETAEERVRWLMNHSPCVTGRLTQDQARERAAARGGAGNCVWSRNLHPDGRRPRGWIREQHGHWSRVRDRWLAHLEAVRDLVFGRDPYRPCAVTPDTWDGVRYGRERVGRGNRTILECAVPYRRPGESEPGLHNFAVVRGTPPS